MSLLTKTQLPMRYSNIPVQKKGIPWSLSAIIAQGKKKEFKVILHITKTVFT